MPQLTVFEAESRSHRPTCKGFAVDPLRGLCRV